MITTALATLAAGFGLTALLSVDPIGMHRCVIPVTAEFQGYSGTLVARLLRDRVRIIAKEAGSARGASNLSYFAEYEAGIEAVTEELKIDGVIRALREWTNLHAYSIGCHIIDQGNDLKLSIEGETSDSELFYISVSGTRDVSILIDKMAERFIERVDPYILALYFFKKELSSGNFNQSLPLIKHSIQVLPIERKPWALLLWGHTFARHGDYDGAIAKYQEALALDPNFAIGLARWGQVLLMKGDKEGGLTKLYEALSKPSAEKYPAIFQLTGDTLAEQGLDNEARDIYVKGLQQHPSHGGLQTSLAALYLRYKQFRPATKLLQDALFQEPQDPRINNLLPQALTGVIASGTSSPTK